MPSIASQWRAFWHTMTSNDRHASHDSPYRSGQHVALPQNRHSPLTSVATSAMESRTDLDSPYKEDLEAGTGFSNSNGPISADSAYSPGMRSMLQRQSSSGIDGKLEGAGPGEIQMQSFADGLPPPPPVTHSWKRIDRWLEDNYEELWENIGTGATINDVNELENELDCTLPQEVRESLQVHDGQERGGMPTGLLFGCMLLDCEEITQEWQNWRTINEVYFSADADPSYRIPQAPIKAFAGSSSASAIPLAHAHQSDSANPAWRQELLDKQDSQPAGAIQKAYAHPAWIPLARDWGGNNICVDLAPGPTGRWGQVILMGRDYDCKYVVARSWAAFLATLADDMNTDKWFIDDESKELKLREFRQPGIEPAYIDILRWRADQKFGRKLPPQHQKKRPIPGQSNGPNALRINSQVSSAPPHTNGFSPYSSPTAEDASGRGRSPQRFAGAANGKAPAHLSSPLARVAEESAPVTKQEKLVSIDTPVAGEPPVGFPAVSSKPAFGSGDKTQEEQESGTNGIERKEEKVVVEEGEEAGDGDGMKEVQI